MSTHADAPLTIVVPCFNEVDNLGQLADRLGQLDARLGPRRPLCYVLVDDGSTDATWAEMRRRFGHRPRFRLVRHVGNRGVAAATLTGVRAAETELVAVIDSDCSYEPVQLERMLPLMIPEVALVTASPYHPDGRADACPRWRLVLSRTLSRLYRLVLRHKLYTYTSCFRIYRRASLKGVSVRDGGFVGVTEILVRLDLQGAHLVESPAVLERRRFGRSKMKILRVVAGHLRLLGELLALRARRSLVRGVTAYPHTWRERA